MQHILTHNINEIGTDLSEFHFIFAVHSGYVRYFVLGEMSCIVYIICKYNVGRLLVLKSIIKN